MNDDEGNNMSVETKGVVALVPNDGESKRLVSHCIYSRTYTKNVWMCLKL